MKLIEGGAPMFARHAINHKGIIPMTILNIAALKSIFRVPETLYTAFPQKNIQAEEKA